MNMHAPDPGPCRLPRWLPVIGCFGFAAFWIWLAVAVHTIPVVGGELDSYRERAQVILNGHLASDRLHPFGLPLLIAGLGWFGLDLFLAGKLIGVAGGLLLVVCAYRLARTWSGRSAAALVAFAVGASSHVLVGAVQACSDVPAAGLLALSLLCWTRCAEYQVATRTLLITGGVAWGLAVSVRTPSLTLLPAFLPVLLGVSWAERARRVAWTGVAGAVGLLPHLLTTWLAGMSLLQNHSQIVWKYRYRFDDAGFLRYLDAPEPVAWSELLHWCQIGLLDWVSYLTTRLGEPWNRAAIPGMGLTLSLCMLVAMVLALFARNRGARVLATGAFVYSVLICVLSLPEGRLVLPMAVLLVVLVTLGWTAAARVRRSLPTGLAGIVAAAASLGIPGTLADFETLHARAEMAAVRQLVAEHGPWITVAMPTVGLDSSIPCLFATYHSHAQVPGAPEDHWGRLLANPAANAAKFVIVGQRTHPEVHAELSRVPPPPDYEQLASGDVLIFRKTIAPWYEEASVDVRDTELLLRLRLVSTLETQAIAAAGFLVRSQLDSDWKPVVLPAGADGVHTLSIPLDVMRGRTWSFIPAMMKWNSSWFSGSPIEVDIPER